MNIYTYYADVPDLPRLNETKLTILWRERWQAAGWEPTVLSEYHAQQHPYYEEYKAAIEKLPSCNPKNYELASWLRWLALAQVGGGWAADYDLFPTRNDTGLWHRITGAEMNKIIIFQRPCCPCLVWCDAKNALRLCKEFATGRLGNRPQDGRGHSSDQYFLEDLVISGADWIEVRDVVKQYPDEGCKDAPLIHYPNAALGPRNLTPKWKNIPALLPP